MLHTYNGEHIPLYSPNFFYRASQSDMPIIVHLAGVVCVTMMKPAVPGMRGFRQTDSQRQRGQRAMGDGQLVSAGGGHDRPD